MSPAPFQIETERDEGFTLTIGGKHSGELSQWRGWRVKYRPLGTRGRWRKFMTADDLEALSVSELQSLCEAHEARGG